MQSSSFTVINEAFVCSFCSKDVPKASTSCRNHCPFCLYSIHVDVQPGDRLSECKGLLKPVGYFFNQKKVLSLNFECQSCGFKGVNKALLEDKNQPDDYDRILRLNKSLSSLKLQHF